MTDWHPPTPSTEYPSLRTPGMRGRVQDHKREPTVESVVTRARSLAAELDPGPRELVLQLANLVETLAKLVPEGLNDSQTSPT